MSNEPRAIEIEYCTGCRWLLRAAWYAQELLSTFESGLDSITLRPSAIAGAFVIRMGDATLFDRGQEKGFIEAKELKRRVRDHIDPDRVLGHIDRL